jgi:type I restriction enzyme S subunit
MPLIAMYGATAGVVSWLKIRAVTNQAVLAVLPRNEYTDSRWLYWTLGFHSGKLLASVQGSGQPNLNKTLIEQLEVICPSFPEQRRIAEILDAADEAIRQAERLIAKLRAAKAGLLHDLLTRGLDEHGHLRDPQAHPEQFKDLPVGRIPQEWNVVAFRGLLEVLYRYPTYYGIEYRNQGVPEVRGELILDDGTLDPRPDCYRCVSEQTAASFPRVRLEAGDFVMSVRGTLGKTAIVPPWLRGAVITANLIRLQFNKARVVPEWANHFLLSKMFQDQLDLQTSATTIKTIQAPALGSILLALPPLEEQGQIAIVLDIHDARIRAEEAALAKLRQVKRGLMDDLLTGRVRVGG